MFIRYTSSGLESQWGCSQIHEGSLKWGAGRAAARATTEMNGGELMRSTSRIGSEAGGPNQRQVWKVSDEKAMKDKVSVESSARAAAGLPGTAQGGAQWRVTCIKTVL